MEKTVATPTSGFPVTASVSPRTPSGGKSSRVLDTPLGPASLRPTAGGIGDVRLHTDSGTGGRVNAREEGGSALKVLLAAVVLLAVAGGTWYVAQQRHSVVPAAPTPVPTAAPAPTAPPEPAPTAVPEPTVVIKEVPTTAVVTFKSNKYAELSINGKRHPASLPAATRVTLKPGRYVAVFDVPGFMKITKEFDVSATDPKPVSVFAEFPGRGNVTFTVFPAGAEIRLDGVLIGASTGAAMKRTLRAGPHEISVSLAGYKTYTRTVDVAEDDSFAMPRIELKKESLESRP